jgi:2-oxoglutarate dehydrogenase E2 component (dihydrolipoamide succinyltransferase)
MATDIVVPNLGESIVEATVAEWLKQEGDSVEVGEAIVVLETEKVDLDVGAEKRGVLAKIVRAKGEDVQVGDVLGVIEESGAGSAKPEAAAQEPEQPEAPDEGEPGAERPPDGAEREIATPVARRLAAEHGVDLEAVSPTGARGRITKEDVERHLAQSGDQKPAPAEPPAEERRPAPSTPQAEPASGDPRGEERVRMSRRRRTIAQRLVEAQRTAAILTTFNEIDMTAMMDLRKRRKEAFAERHGVGLGIASFFVKAAVGALKVFPQINAEIDGDDIILKQYYDIGMAIGAEEGLVVPVLRDADRMSFAEIERAIKDFAQRAGEGTLTLDDLRGGTFTITNGGVFGSLMSTPILNPPQVGILGLHKIEQRPVALDGEVVIRPMMYVALSYDHRVVDGRESVQFLMRIKELVEDPERLLLEG